MFKQPPFALSTPSARACAGPPYETVGGSWLVHMEEGEGPQGPHGGTTTTTSSLSVPMLLHSELQRLVVGRHPLVAREWGGRAAKGCGQGMRAEGTFRVRSRCMAPPNGWAWAWVVSMDECVLTCQYAGRCSRGKAQSSLFSSCTVLHLLFSCGFTDAVRCLTRSGA